MLSVKQGGIKYYFWVFGITRPGTEPWSPGPLASVPNITETQNLKKMSVETDFYSQISKT